MIMTKLVLKSFNNVYLLRNTIFANKINLLTFQKWNLEKYCNTRMLHCICKKSSKKAFGTESRSFEKSQLIKGVPKFFSNSASNGLMNIEIQYFVPLLKKFANPFQYIRIRRFDSEFDIMDFKESAKYALELVLKYLSNEQYSDLDTLLTPECKFEVEENVKMMPPEKRLALAMNSVDIFAEDGFFNVREGDGQTFGEITMIYYFFANDSKEIASFKSFMENLVKESKANSTKNFRIYNCTYIKNLTDSSNDQWKINKISFSSFQPHRISRFFK